MNQKKNKDEKEKHTMDFKCFFSFSLAKFRTSSIGKWRNSSYKIHYYSKKSKWEEQDLNQFKAQSGPTCRTNFHDCYR